MRDDKIMRDTDAQGSRSGKWYDACKALETKILRPQRVLVQRHFAQGLSAKKPEQSGIKRPSETVGVCGSTTGRQCTERALLCLG